MHSLDFARAYIDELRRFAAQDSPTRPRKRIARSRGGR